MVIFLLSEMVWKSLVMRLLNWWMLRFEVSIISLACILKSESVARSFRIPSEMVSFSARGCWRRVSLKRLISISSLDSKKSIFMSWPFSLSPLKISGYSFKKVLSRTSITIATLVIAPDETSHSSINFGRRIGGKLSMQKKPRSSKARIAVLLPEPDSPVMITIDIFCMLLIQKISPRKWAGKDYWCRTQVKGTSRIVWRLLILWTNVWADRKRLQVNFSHLPV